MNKETLICLLAFLMDASGGLAGLCVPLLADRLGATYDDLGFIGATGAGVYALTCLVSGRLADRLGYRRTMAVSAVGMVLIYLLYTRADRVLHLGMLAAAVGALLAFYWPVMQAWLGSDADRPRLLKALGAFNVAWSLGFLVGPAAGGHLFAADPDLPFYIVAAAAGVVVVALSVVRVRRSALPSLGPAIPDARRGDPRFRHVAWIANFCTFYAIGNVRALWPKYAAGMGFGAASIGDLLALIGFAQVASFFLIARTDRWQFRLGPLAAAQALGILGLVLLAFGESPLIFALGLLLSGVLIGVTFTSSIFYSLNVEGPAGGHAGIHEAIIGSGFLFGPLCGGLLADHIGPRAPYLVAGLVLLVGILLQAGHLRRTSAPAIETRPPDASAAAS